MDVGGMSAEALEQAIRSRREDIVRLREECKRIQVELDRQARAKTVQEETERFHRMSPADQLALLQAIGATQIVDVPRMSLSSSVP